MPSAEWLLASKLFQLHFTSWSEILINFVVLLFGIYIWYSSTLQDEICDICGDVGFDNALATCTKCYSNEHGYDNTLTSDIRVL